MEIEKFLFLGKEYPLKFGREGFVLSDKHLDVAKEMFINGILVQTKDGVLFKKRKLKLFL